MNRRTCLDFDPLESRAMLSGLSTTVTTDHPTYQPGQSIVMTFSESNISSQPIAVEDGPSIDGFEVSQGNRLVWRSNAGNNPLFIRLVSLLPGQSFTRSATWNGVPDGGNPPITGTVTIRNELDPSVSTTAALAAQGSNPSTSTPGGPTHLTVVSGDPFPVAAPMSGGGPASSPSMGDPTPSTTSDPGGGAIVVTVATNRAAYRRGHPVQMTLTLRNGGDSSIALPVRSRPVFTVRQDSGLIWRHATARSAIHSRVVPPGQTITMTSVWNGRGRAASVPQAVGIDTLEASLGGYSASTTLAIKN